MCPNRQMLDPEKCSHCPPSTLMKEFEIIIDFYFDTLRQKKLEERCQSTDDDERRI